MGTKPRPRLFAGCAAWPHTHAASTNASAPSAETPHPDLGRQAEETRRRRIAQSIERIHAGRSPGM